MRILSVRFKNLNSLAGEWFIDFSHPEYLSNGLFAITGPTGSGKTTILDAVCLGLYGRTPRLDKVTKTTNEIMSRQAGECFAEVTFETQRGRYQCQWSQHRARKRPDGELQPARHEISDLDTATVLESKINKVSEVIENATGMKYEQFTRSMLLAQGGFAAFLQASADNRSPILEQITGTHIYSEISKKVHERYSNERETLELLQAELKGLQVLSEDEKGSLETSLKEKKLLADELGSKLEAKRQALAWFERIATLEKELGELDEAWEDNGRRWEMFEPLARKLEWSRKALAIEGDHRGVVSLRSQQASEEKELRAAGSALAEKDKAHADALASRQVAETGLNEARAAQISGSETLKKVRDIDARISERRREREERDKALLAIEKEVKAYNLAIEQSERDMERHREALAGANDYMEKSSRDARLLTHLSAITRSFEMLRAVESKRSKKDGEFAASAAKKEAASVECKKYDVSREKLRQQYEAGRDSLGALADEIASILKGRDIGEWRGELESLKDRERLLVQAGQMVERIEKSGASVKDLSKELESLKAGRAVILKEIKSAGDDRALLERQIEQGETEVSLLTRIRDLEEERKRLQDDKPCPLCGSTDHPYAAGNVPELNVAESVLKEKRAQFKKASEIMGALEARYAKKEAEIGHVEKERADKTALRALDEEELARAVLALRIDAAPENRAALLREESSFSGAKIAEISGIVSLAEEKGRKEKSARDALEKKRLEFERSEKTLQETLHKAETAGLDHERLGRDCASLKEEAESAQAQAQRDVEPYGIGQIQADSLEETLKLLTERKDRWIAVQDEKTVHEKNMTELAAAIDKSRALVESLEKDLTAKRKEREKLQRDYQGLSASRRMIFGDKDPDEVEKKLFREVERRGKALEEAREEHAKIESAMSALRGKIADLTESVCFRGNDLAHAEEILSERIKTAGFIDEPQYLASRLSDAQREKLAGEDSSLIKERTELQARRKDRLETLACEREKNLSAERPGKIQEEIGACEAELKETGFAIGGILNSLSEDKKMKEKQQERLRQIEAQKRESSRWNDLRELIGSADGKKFRNFAQSLTFEMMTRHANRQLRKMTDRYVLIRDEEQPLELNVIDNYQAGEIRSTKNLSGGESFIVSLALALGLSHMASRNVRVDSLFLDEGFGTLDEDALETALETLAGLQQDGKLIGVISHVPAFKERISTRIQVIPERGGCSSLCGPGCRRIQ